MFLLCAAHKGEIQSFIQSYTLKKSTNPILELYEGKSFDILITGEGLFNASNSLMHHLSKSADKYSYVVNLGIAGSLNYNIHLENIYEVRTCLCEFNNSIEFNTYETALLDLKVSEKPLSRVDCISSSSRVTNEEYRQHLSVYADIVDRESWSLSMVCKKLKTPFICYKLISDNANQNELCEQTVNNSKNLSDILLKFFRENIDKFDNITSNKEKKDLYSKIFKKLEKSFYFTNQQKIKLIKIFTKLLKDFSIHDQNIFIKKLLFDYSYLINDQSITPKNKTKILILSLEEKAFPLKHRINKRALEIIETFQKSGHQVTFDQKFEKSEILISSKINSSKDIDKLINDLQKFNYDQFLNFLEGDLD